jgi:hypothetical protein
VLFFANQSPNDERDKMLSLVLIILLFNITTGQRRRYEPYWISTKTQAEAIGVDLKRFLDVHCSATVNNTYIKPSCRLE